MTATNGQTGTAESTGTVQVAPPPFHVPAGSACVEDCDDAPLGWSSPGGGRCESTERCAGRRRRHDRLLASRAVD